MPCLQDRHCLIQLSVVMNVEPVDNASHGLPFILTVLFGVSFLIGLRLAAGQPGRQERQRSHEDQQ